MSALAVPALPTGSAVAATARAVQDGRRDIPRGARNVRAARPNARGNARGMQWNARVAQRNARGLQQPAYRSTLGADQRRAQQMAAAGAMRGRVSRSVAAAATAVPVTVGQSERPALRLVVNNEAVRESSSAVVMAEPVAERSSAQGILRVAMVVAAMILALAGVLAVGTVMTSSAPEAMTSVVVQPGQSVWDIAQGIDAGNVGERAAQIASLNHLADGPLQPGQVLIVPAE